jgi:hypothetical protein
MNAPNHVEPATRTPASTKRPTSLRVWLSVLLLWPAIDFSSAMTFVLGAGQSPTLDSWVYVIVAALLAGAVALVWLAGRNVLLLAYFPIGLALVLARRLPLVGLVVSLLLVALLRSELPKAEKGAGPG